MAGLTAKQMWYEAKVAYEAIASADAPGYSPRQWSILLTQAQEKVVLNRCKQGLDFDEGNRRVVAKLLKEDITSGTPYPEIPNAYRVQFKEDYLYIVKDTANNYIRIKPIPHDYYHTNIENPFEQPYDKLFWRLLDEDGAIIITSGAPVEKYHIVYVARPEPIVVQELTEETAIEGHYEETDCKLDPIVHREIVSGAARLAHAYTSNQAGYQIQSIEDQR